MLGTTQKTWTRVVVLIVIAVIGFAAGQSVGFRKGYDSGDADGYKRAEADIKRLEEDAAEKAAAEAAKAANPFQVANPLEGVETNPFEKAKRVLNPF